MNRRGFVVPILAGILMLSLHSTSSAFSSEAKVVKVSKLFDMSVQLPTDVVVSRSKKVYVVDGTNNVVVVFNYSGERLFSFGGKGSASGLFLGPTGIGIDKDDTIYVCDSGNRRVQVFSESGKFLYSLVISDGPLGPSRPVDIAINNRTKMMYITDGGNHRIVVYEMKGKQVYEWGGRGESPQEFRYPATVTFNEYLYVVDALNSRVQVFEGAGLYVRSIGKWGVLPGELFRPKGVALDDENNIYVSDSFMDVIEVFKQGGFSHVLGDEEGNIRRFSSPLGIFVDGNRLFVAEMLADRVGVYSLGN